MTLDKPARDTLLDELPAEGLKEFSDKLVHHCGVSITRAGGVYTLTHVDSRAFVQKPKYLTLYGAWRLAAHMMKAMDDQL